MAKKILGVRLTPNNIVVASVAVVLVIAGIFSQFYWRNLQSKATFITGKTYYIDKDNKEGKGCNDSWPGTKDQPFCTFKPADIVLQPGDGVYFRAGTYPPIAYAKSGGPDKYITIGSYPGERAVISGGSDGILVRGSYIVISGFEVKGATGQWLGGIRMAALNNTIYPHHNIIEDNIVHDNVGTNTYGIIAEYSSHTIIRNNTVYNNYQSGISLSQQDSVDPGYDLVGNEISGNTSYNNTLGGGNTDGIKVEGWRYKNATIKNNTVYGNGDDGIDTWNSSGNTLIGNRVYNQKGPGDGNGFKLGGKNRVTGMSVGGSNAVVQNISYGNKLNGFDSNGSGGNKYYNNVSYANTGLGFEDGWKDAPCTVSTCQSVYINNIGYNNTRANFSASQYTAVSHNNIWFSDSGGAKVFYNYSSYANLADFYKASGNRLDNPAGGSLSSFAVNPMFVNTSGSDFSLQQGSSAIDKGDQTNPGGISISGSAPDIGAREYGSTQTTTPPTAPIATQSPSQPINTSMPTVASSPVPTVVDTTVPTITISSPADGSTISSKGNQNISASVQDPESGITSIKIYFDNTVIKVCTNTTTCSGSVKMNNVSTGSHAVVVVAVNHANLTNSQAIVVSKK